MRVSRTLAKKCNILSKHTKKPALLRVGEINFACLTSVLFQSLIRIHTQRDRAVREIILHTQRRVCLTNENRCT